MTFFLNADKKNVFQSVPFLRTLCIVILCYMCKLLIILLAIYTLTKCIEQVAK